MLFLPFSSVQWLPSTFNRKVICWNEPPKANRGSKMWKSFSCSLQRFLADKKRIFLILYSFSLFFCKCWLFFRGVPHNPRNCVNLVCVAVFLCTLKSSKNFFPPDKVLHESYVFSQKVDFSDIFCLCSAHNSIHGATCCWSTNEVWSECQTLVFGDLFKSGTLPRNVLSKMVNTWAMFQNCLFLLPKKLSRTSMKSGENTEENSWTVGQQLISTEHQGGPNFYLNWSFGNTRVSLFISFLPEANFFEVSSLAQILRPTFIGKPKKFLMLFDQWNNMNDLIWGFSGTFWAFWQRFCRKKTEISSILGASQYKRLAVQAPHSTSASHWLNLIPHPGGATSVH